MYKKNTGIEWPTLAMLAATYLVCGAATTVLFGWSPLVAILLAGCAIAQFSSLQHEVLHGHPFQSTAVNEALVFPALTITVPYGRFRDLHLRHHYDPNLTDPYDDPESNFHDPDVWATLPKAAQFLFRVNNTLLGRIVLGPLIGATLWLTSEARLIMAGDRSARRSWLLHLGGLAMVIGWLWLAAMPWWAYLASVWIGHSLLKIRTFLEHRAHAAARGRTVIIEDRGPLALLFLNNNFHALHHMHPNVPWYKLPAIYAARRPHILRRNLNYVYPSYLSIFRQFLFVAKDPVPHPIWPVDKGSVQTTEGGAAGGIVKEGHAAGLILPAE